MTKFKVGDRVTALVEDYSAHEGKDLEVMFVDKEYEGIEHGYGVGIVGNDPEVLHDGKRGWLYYTEDELAPC